MLSPPRDTVTQLISAMRRVRRSVSQAALVPLKTASDEGGKPIIEWSDESARNALVTGLVNDALAVLGAAESVSLSKEAHDDVGLLALIAGQDVEPGEQEGTWRIAKKVAKDRVISTVDTQARPDGFKAHLSTEPDTGIVTAAKLTPANHPDGPVGVYLMEQEPEGLEVLADSAYGSERCAPLLGRRTTASSSNLFPPVPTSPAGSSATTSRSTTSNGASPARPDMSPGSL